MRTSTSRRRGARTHHPHVACDPRGRWRWTCECGAGGHGQASPSDWRCVVVAALVHTAAMPGE